MPRYIRSLPRITKNDEYILLELKKGPLHGGEMSARTGIDYRTCFSALKKLKEAGFLSSEQRPNHSKRNRVFYELMPEVKQLLSYSVGTRTVGLGILGEALYLFARYPKAKPDNLLFSAIVNARLLGSVPLAWKGNTSLDKLLWRKSNEVSGYAHKRYPEVEMKQIPVTIRVLGT